MSVKSNINSLTPRGSKLLVEMVIGIIGLLGIMLAQAVEPELGATFDNLQHKRGVVSAEVSDATQKIDWIDILF